MPAKIYFAPHLLGYFARNPLVNGENIEIRGFGSFTVRHYDYTGRNPKTGEKKVVKAKKLPFFKVGKELKEAVDGGSK